MLSACVQPSPDNPYPGSGGDYFRYPDQAELADPNKVFDQAKLDRFVPGTATKRDIVAALGKPAWWTQTRGGYSLFGYDFHTKEPVANAPGTVPVEFAFDSANVLAEADYAGIDPARTGRTAAYAFVHVRIGAEYKMIDGVVPASWVNSTPEGTESIYLGSFVRQRITIDRVVAGQIEGRRHTVLFTVSTPHVGRWNAYMLLKTTANGRVGVVWWDYTPFLCNETGDASTSDALKAVIAEAKASPVCRKAKQR